MTHTTFKTRDLLPDLVRAFALIGIVLVNVELFSRGLSESFLGNEDKTLLDRGVIATVFGLFTMKSYSLFSMMFGIGLGYQLQSASLSSGTAVSEEATQTLFTGRYFRRMTGLLVIGLVHAIFFFLGDILVTYALLGFLLYLMRNMSPKQLIIGGIGLIILQVLLLLSMALFFYVLETLPEGELRTELMAGMDPQQNGMAAVDDALRNGGFFGAALGRLTFYPTLLMSLPMVQGIAALGYFLLGLSFYKLGLIGNLSHRFWRTSRQIFFPLGLVISGASGWIYSGQSDIETGTSLLMLTTNMLASPLFTFGVIGWLAKVCESGFGPVLRFIARGGSASLTAYLFQSLVLSLVFCGYGLGFFGAFSTLTCVSIALVTGIVSICVSSLWLKFFKRGPMETLLRRWTYRGETSAKA